MTVLTEGDLQIRFSADVPWRKFDDEKSHGLSHCMKAVDFIVELEDRILFIEFKDPEHPDAKQKDRQKFMQKFLSGELDGDLKTKYRDSFLYEWASGRLYKPIYFLVLMGASMLSTADLLVRTDALKRQIPLAGPDDKAWEKPFLAGCAVMDLSAWNHALPQFPAARISG